MNLARQLPALSRLRSAAFALALVALCAGAGCSSTSQKGAPWTIRCLELRGEIGVRQINDVAETLRRTPGFDASEVRVFEKRDGSAAVYYGTYRRSLDPETGRRATPRRLREDLDALKELGTADGRRLFIQAIPVRMPTPDVGPPEWDLRNVRARYSLQIAVFEPTEEFWQVKQAALDFCRDLRERGYEAYYFHADASSIVTVGAFGPEALLTRADGRRDYSLAVKKLQQDELLKFNLLNGRIYNAKSDAGKFVPVPSRLVEVPGGEEGWQ